VTSGARVWEVERGVAAGHLGGEMAGSKVSKVSKGKEAAVVSKVKKGVDASKALKSKEKPKKSSHGSSRKLKSSKVKKGSGVGKEKRPKGPGLVTDKWTAKDFALEAVKRTLTGERKWVQLRTLGKWWGIYAKRKADELVKALDELQAEHQVRSKGLGRSWRLGGRAREVTWLAGKSV
jgi:hypothetical protein